MKTEKPKQKKTSENKALARPEKNKPAQAAFYPEELAASPWGKLVMFVNESYSEWVPQSYKSQEIQEAIAPIHKKCSIVLKEEGDSWEEILTNKFESVEYKAAENFFFHLSRKYKESPQTVRQQLQENLSQFVELAEYALADSENRDLTKMSELGEVIDYFKKSQERTFLFLSELPYVLEEEARDMLKSSQGYQTLLNWGSSRSLNEFGWQLQRKFGIARKAVTHEKKELDKHIVKKKVKELGETKVNQQVELLNEELASSPWGRLVKFFNDSYKYLVPTSQRNQEKQEAIAPIHKKCSIVLKEEGDSWEEILANKFESFEYKMAENFFFHLSRKYRESPETVRQQLQANLSQFVELAEYAFAHDESRDLTKLSEFSEVIDYFKKSQERTFLFLSELPSVVDEKVRDLLNSSAGYQALLKWGASRFLNELGWQLQREFNITPTAIKEEAAQNLVRELGETEANLTNQVELLQQENEKLKKELSGIRSQALQSAVCQFVTTLQKQSQPVLDQIILLYQRLNKMSESNSELSLSASDSLSILIALENLLQALQSLNVTRYPVENDRVFELRSDQLSVYEYIEGSAFANSEDKKIVRCIHPGWRVGEEVITPARVKEVTE